jgi:hypothetical protein
MRAHFVVESSGGITRDGQQRVLDAFDVCVFNPWDAVSNLPIIRKHQAAWRARHAPQPAAVSKHTT